MKRLTSRLLVLILAIAVAFSLTSCDIVFDIIDSVLGEEGELPLPDGPGGSTNGTKPGGDNPGTNPGGDDPGTNPGGDNPGTNPGGDDPSTGGGGTGSDEKDDGKIEILPDDNQQIDPENPYSGLQSGYNIVTDKVDPETHEVSSYYEADRIVDRAIAQHYSKVTIDFGPMGDAYSLDQLKKVGAREMGHTNITFSYYPSSPEVVTFVIEYDATAASYVLPATPEISYDNYKNGNMLIRDHLNGESGRAADYEGFAINTENNGTMDVYNSEELWWALEHNYLPTFPMENTKAEAFYNEAKRILREIISDDMTDYEKTLAIFEYLVDMVYYDYDAYNDMNAENAAGNACYYLEGVFEYNRAVCDGKSKAFVLLCRIEGIECVRDWGSAVGAGAGHAWNYVKLDGVWYMVDTTAGDSGLSMMLSDGTVLKFELVNYDYFLCPVNTYKENSGYDDSEYNYSGVWNELLKNNDNDASATDIYLDYDVNAEGVDFIITSAEEFELLAEIMFEAEANWNYILVLAVSEELHVGQMAYDLEQKYENVECLASSSRDLFIFTILPVTE